MGHCLNLQVRRDVDGVLQTEDIIPNKQSLIVYSSKGYIKRMTPDLFSIQVQTSLHDFDHSSLALSSMILDPLSKLGMSSLCAIQRSDHGMSGCGQTRNS